MSEIILSLDIQNHSLADMHYFRDMLDRKPLGKYHVYVTAERIRTVSQNEYYFGVVLKIIAEYTGHTALELHQQFKVMFNAKGRQVKGNVLVFGGTTTVQNTIRFTQYLEDIRLWALYFLGLTIPEPTRVPEEMMLNAKANHQ